MKKYAVKYRPLYEDNYKKDWVYADSPEEAYMQTWHTFDPCSHIKILGILKRKKNKKKKNG